MLMTTEAENPKAATTPVPARPVPTQPPVPVATGTAVPAISVRNLSVSFGNNLVLKRVTFDIPPSFRNCYHRSERLRQIHLPPLSQPDA